VEEILGDHEGGSKRVRLRDTKTGKVSEKAVQGVFIAIGHNPNTKLFRERLRWTLSDTYHEKREHQTKSGVFAAGDVKDSKYRQAITAVGVMAAIDDERFLEGHA
jgi:thioredoxin reductase (NADPH)